ncbi:bacillithiol system redox-active protein YtxJ [Arenibacter certesii]|uniref:Thioredoxin family protein n=1 Tax=Arenibacter certesii TaxID=228955 RepID=A0A918J263_9FLAO|nr:bacillithiol system redox-active protein YtxJ [Arenibacter certesii]GGW43304.1 thioredoxin family protein [Arenibacter certesii]
MGILNRIFGKDNTPGKEEKEIINVPWIPLVSLDQLVEIKEKSSQKTQIIFKHSTTCGVSRMVMNRFNESYTLSSDQVDLYYLDLHSYRNISNEVANLFQLRHESPQLLIIKNGVVVAHDSHSGISQLNLGEYV